MRFDLVVRGGHVIDPLENRDGLFDVALQAGRVAAVETRIPPEMAARSVDASGMLVLPGLIDLHTHVFHRFTYWGVDPDSLAYDSGVTTWVDAGSAGAISMGALREHVVKAADVHVRAFMNVSCIGLVAPDFELSQPEYLDAGLFERAMRGNGDLVIGIKARMSTPTVGSNGTLPLRIAREIADAYGLPIMVHISDAPPQIDEVLELLAEGDIVTHCFTAGSMKLVGDNGLPRTATRRAIDRGVLLDVGHGAGSFAFSSAEALLGAGIQPYVISTDIHQMSLYPGALLSNDAVASPIIRIRDEPSQRLDLPLCMSKFLALGMSLTDVVRAVTAHPAAIVRAQGEIGTLRPGARGDFGLFKLMTGDFVYHDVFGGQHEGTQQLVNIQTFVGGHPLQPRAGASVAPWVERVTTDAG
jgi:dihydroorotase